MTYRSPVRASTVVFVASLVALVIAACGGSGGSSFEEGDGGGTSGGSTNGGPNTSSGGFGQDDGGSSGTSGTSSGSSGDDDDTTCAQSDACAPTAVCGDKKIEGAEVCDDGNAIPGDGCSGTCQIEPGYTCPTPGETCIYTVAVSCGDGKIQGNEACDDGNKTDGDGCSAACGVEPGYTCTTPGQKCVKDPEPRCGDGSVSSGENCDDGNTNPGDGCDASCNLELGFVCPTPGQPCVPLQYCGDGILQAANGEECDDKNAVPGDGCSGVCKLEAGYSCTPGNPCVKIWVCGNGKVDPGESCDDSNTVAGDGCAADCLSVEGGYTCPATGGPCTKAPTAKCGDALLAANEQCDDGNTTSGDGCTAGCSVEPGYDCPTVGQKCVKIAKCGDGKVDAVLFETCDDGNATAGDGCSDKCVVEQDFVCPTPGQKCISTFKCGDGKITSTKENCDDTIPPALPVSGDGCDSTCHREAGWVCPFPGRPCQPAACGDGIKVGNEECDDKNTVDGDGCSSKCTIETKTTTTNPTTTDPGETTITHYKCPTAGVKCTVAVCGNGPAPNSPEGSEQCDDGNVQAYDGCSPLCTIEPKCPGGTCVGVCGDGTLTDAAAGGTETCDDGNKTDGDGCSSTCKVEDGYTCPLQTGSLPAFIDIPVVFRDFRYSGDTAGGGLPAGHPDFESFGCDDVTTGLVKDKLSNVGNNSSKNGGVPVFNAVRGTGGCGFTQDKDQLTDAAKFDEWYKNGTRAYPITDKQLRLNKVVDAQGTSYVFDSANDQPWKTKGGFFPIDGEGWGNEGGNAHNFAFTTELRYWFTYDKTKAPTLIFSGDDDVWVFINGHLALDVGGLHPRQERQFDLTTAIAGTLGLADGHLYEIALFHAERHTSQSNFKLTLRGFVQKTTKCTNVCGDKILTREEQCDDGTAANTGGYGKCKADCTLDNFCGDSKTTNPPETCDDGVNATSYGGTSKVCGPGCVYAPYCGDAKVSNGEQCDDGTANNTGAYGKCSSNCLLGPRCGDGVTQTSNGEQCDSGAAKNGTTGDPCKADCKLRCGDGVVQQGEECDNGTAANTGGYGKCKADCTLGPRCGDGIQTGTEQCDDGKNDGSYGTCKSDCSLADYCGDSKLTNPPEACDLGPLNSATAYGDGKCTNRCTPAPRCGDKAVDPGETCDDGVNDGTPGHCTSDCKGFTKLDTCGNGKTDAGEQCDHGTNNGKAGDTCDSHCRNTCGNGVKEVANGETCDNGVNDGSYGGCTANCQIAGYCGDGVKNGPEACDNGAGNVSIADAYGPGVCTQACTFAPYCGDGRIQSSRGEQCDGSATCDASCHTTGPH